MSNYELKPILKWVGGKRQLLDDILPMIPDYDTYFEPFIGGGAVLFELNPKKAVINDLNEELINLYQTIKNNPHKLISQLEIHSKNNNKEYFYNIRALDRLPEFKKMSNIEKAARTIYLNKTCFNGLYRVNKKGEFNTPFGRYRNPNIINRETIMAINKYFNSNDIKIRSGDFTSGLEGIKMGDFVYFDPPYLPISNSSNFTSYTKDGFDWNLQLKLKEKIDELDKLGVKFLLSNSAHEDLLELYKDYNIKLVKARRSINSKGNSRGEINEILVFNYKIDEIQTSSQLSFL